MNLSSLFSSKKALVVGDLMLDLYTRGDVERISPEAPVLILKVGHESSLPGGAGNAIVNMISLGMQVRALGRIGSDPYSHLFCDLLKNEGVDTSSLFIEDGFKIPVKKRFIADTQQLLRVDYETISPLPSALENQILSRLPTLFEGIDVVAISDYGKGFLTPTLLQEVISYARSRNIPVIVDPKGTQFKKYRGASLIKPNLSEAAAAVSLDKRAPIDEIGHKLLAEHDIETVMITRSKDGISIFSRDRPRADFPATVREIKDVTGAGDTVLAIITQVLANNVDLHTGAKLANAAAGIAIEKVGCARISLADLSHRLLELRINV